MRRNRERAFSLIELMIVIAIVALLAMVAYPSYMESVRKTRRAEGMALVNKVMQAEERFFMNNLTYTADLTDMGFAVSGDLPSENGHYQLNAGQCDADAITECVEIVATALGGQAADGDLSYNSRGEKDGNWD